MLRNQYGDVDKLPENGENGDQSWTNLKLARSCVKIPVLGI
jgi:hypothetical protein